MVREKLRYFDDELGRRQSLPSSLHAAVDDMGTNRFSGKNHSRHDRCNPRSVDSRRVDEEAS